MIQVSAAAVREIQRIHSSQSATDRAVRIQIQPGGCCGYYYVLELTAPDNDEPIYLTNGIAVTIDPASHSYLQELQVDFSEDLMGGGFRFHNPNAQTTCSCGASFSPPQPLRPADKRSKLYGCK
ncbi:MAG: iron-sulfur cluster assembly accessory protein [Chloroflexaceae bacterium]|nr:iron-sulfur cluster assembly accessory protein [Chloroflexaceae bacterium]